ncbi:MAG: alpha/beta hydrolase [Ferruginibacter sp.]
MKIFFLISMVLFAKIDFAQIQKDTATSQTNIVLETATGKIFGTLCVPAVAKRKIPVVLMISGSGPTDRNCNSTAGFTCNSFKMLADSLLQFGIASLRYDKRGVGESKLAGGKEEDLRFEDYVNDAVDFVNLLKKDNRFSTVIILGHSEGSLIGMLAAQKIKVSKYISVAGPGLPLPVILKKQISAQPKEIQDMCFPIIDSLANGYSVKTVDPVLYSLFRPSLQPFIISLFKYDPALEIAKLSIPVAIIQGNTDIQVSEADAEKLHGAYPESEYHIIQSMSHILKDGPTDRAKNYATYNSPTMPILSAFVQSVVTFIHK